MENIIHQSYYRRTAASLKAISATQQQSIY